jgi:chemotaxis protein MotB
VTGEGLRIELSESEKGVFFESGSPQPSAAGLELLKMLASELGKLPNSLLIEGHTDSKPYNSSTYSNWELSADRANAARRMMTFSGLRPNQVVQVRGFADQHLRDHKNPENPSNRRISVIVKYRSPTKEELEEEIRQEELKASKESAHGAPVAGNHAEPAKSAPAEH